MAKQKLMMVLATEKAVKNAAENQFTATYRDVQKPDLVSGFVATYAPRKEGDEVFPTEKKLVVVRVEEQLASLVRSLADLFDVTATKDWANCNAKADVAVDGKTILTGVPATHLLFIEKKLVDLIGFAKALPVLAPDESWLRDEAQGLFVTEPARTVKTKKLERFDVVVQATKEFPAQVQKVVEDAVIGDWTKVKMSGALPRDRALAIVERAEKLARAVKMAREEANTVEAPPASTGAAVLGYVFGA